MTRHLPGATHDLPGTRRTLASYQSRHFRYVVDGAVATITLDRPERKNPLTFDSYAELPGPVPRDGTGRRHPRDRRHRRG